MQNYYKCLFFMAVFTLYSCGGGGDSQDQEQRDASEPKQEQGDTSEQDTLAEKDRSDDINKIDTTEWQTYRNEDFHVAVKYPADWKVTEQGEPFHIINIYSPEHEDELELPLKIHNDPIASHVSFFPSAYGTELPAGRRVSLEEWKGYIPTDFEVDKQNSIVFLTEDREAWGFLISLRMPPEGWSENGFIFSEIKTTKVSFTCIDKESGEQKPMSNCQPLMGDTVKREGKISTDDRKKIMKIFETLYFFDEANERRPLEDLIKVDNPQPDDTITSPLEITGKARGYWYFEGDFPVELVDKEGKVIGNGIARATEEWMTEDFVPFEVTIDYENPGEGEGYLLFKRSNASGMPEHDRTYRIPVNFKEKD